MNANAPSSRASVVRPEGVASLDGTATDNINERANMNVAVPPSDERPPTTTCTPEKAAMVALPFLLLELEEQMNNEPGSEAYLEALRKAPAVVNTEANPLQFLRREDFNVAAAARRMCKYWNLRKEAFGDRFARPLLDLSGNGALPQESIDLMTSTGVVVVLPMDDQGRSVICNDLARIGNLSRLETVQHRMRCIFFLYCEACMNPKSQTEGIVVLRVLLDAFDTRFSADQFKRTLVHLMEHVLPARMHAFHVCCLPSQKAARRHFAKTVLPQFVQALGPVLAQKIVIHVEGNPDKMAEKLSAFGLNKVGLPPSLGGDWSYENHFERLLGEDNKLPASPRVDCRLKAATHAEDQEIQNETREDRKTQQTQMREALTRPKDAGLSSLANAAQQARLEHRKTRKRTMDATYARNRRQREKNEYKKLHQQCLELTEANVELERENERFDKILTEAKLNITLVQYGMSIASTKQNQERMVSMIAPTESVKRPKIVASYPIGGVNQCPLGGNGGISDFSRRVAGFPPPAFSEGDSSRTSRILDALNQMQQVNPTRQMDVALFQALASRQAHHESHQINDQQSLMRQVEATLICQNPQQALAIEFFNQKNSMQGEANLPPQYQDLLGFRAGHGIATPMLSHLPQPTTHAVQSMLNQLLVANVAQPTGLSGLQDFATALSSRQFSSRHQNPTMGESQNDILRQILLLSSQPTGYRQSPSSD